MQKKAARLCCAILLMAVAIAASMGLMSAVFAAQSLRTPDIQAAEAPTEAPLMLVRVLFCTDGEISEITIQDEAGQELQRLIPGRDGSAVSARLEPGRYRAVTTLGEAVFTLLPNASVRAESGPCWSDGEQLHLTAVPVGSVLVQRSLAAGEQGCLEFTLTDNDGFERRAVVYPGRGRKRPLQPVRRAARHNIRPAGKRRPARHRHADGGRAGAARPARALRTLSNCQILLAGSD